MSQPESALAPQSPPEPTSEPVRDRTKGSIDRRQWKFLLRIVVLVLLVVLGYKLVRAGLYGMAAYNSASELKQAVSRDLSADDIVQAQAALADVAHSTAALEREMRLFRPLLRGARVVPGYGATVAALPELLSAGSEYTFIASETARMVAEAQAVQPEASLPQLGLAALENNPEAFAILSEHAGQARTALERIDAHKLAPELSEPIAQLQSIAVLADAGLALAPQLPELMGFHGPKNYLLLVQNNHELRATGGFISAIGTVSIENGVPGDIDLTDSYNIKRDDVDHPWAPDPMQEHMGIQLVFVRDANWSPDLPTTGQLVRTLYNQDAGTLVDGVVTVDLRAVELLVGALGPLKVKGTEQQVTGENLVEQIKLFWDRPIETGDTKESAGLQEWWKQRKDFMPALAEAALNRVRSGRFNPLAVADAGKAALDERAIQVWLANAEADAVLAENGWNGSVQPVEGADLVGLVDTNMGYNKVDAVLERSLAYTVTWPDGVDEPAQAVTAVTYKHPTEVPGHECNQKPRYGDNYDAMTERCYFDFVRLYVPAGSSLVSAEGVDPETVDVAFGENGTTVLSGYFEMLPGTEHTVRFAYQLPDTITPEDYRLAIRRQSGSGALPVQVNVNGEVLNTIVTEGQLVWDLATE